ILRGIAWAAFALLLVGIGVLFLAACDLGLRPLLGLRYCTLAAMSDLAGERERERALRARIHEAELRIAQLPECAPEPQPQPPPPPAPEPSPAPAPRPAPKAEEPLNIPSQVSDLKGCWQSARGDMQMVTDDEEKRPIGKVRVCYCFGSDGRGKARWI